MAEMARLPIRFYVKDPLQHIIQRRHNRDNIVVTKGGDQFYLECLADAANVAKRFPCVLSANIAVVRH